MLTVQMQNQDPLNPVDSSDYAVQLATFSNVEQQVQTNDILRELQSQMGLKSRVLPFRQAKNLSNGLVSLTTVFHFRQASILLT